MNPVQYQGSPGGGLGDTSRGNSSSIWCDCPWSEIQNGTKDGILVYDDFVAGPRVAAGAEAAYSGYAGGYRGFADTGGLVQDALEWGGVLDLGSDGDNEGASFRTASASFQIARNQGKFWFECRVKTNTIADTKHGIIAGLMADNVLSATLPLTALGAIADVDIVGFHRLEGDGDFFDCVYKAGGVAQVTVLADAVPIVADTFVKLGMVFDPRTNILTFFRNGLKIANYTMATAAGTDFPNDVRLGLVVAVLNATATAPGTTRIDWWRAAQLAP